MRQMPLEGEVVAGGVGPVPGTEEEIGDDAHEVCDLLRGCRWRMG